MAKIKTSDKILDCATSMFAQYGYNGTIMDELAQQCEVNKASIYYHHKDKATLYEHALDHLFGIIADAVLDAVAQAQTPEEKLKAHIDTFAKESAKHPHFSAILMREMASGGKNMPQRASEQMQRILFTLKDILLEGTRQKVFKTSNPMIIHFMIVGTVNLFISSIPFRAALKETAQSKSLPQSNIDTVSKQIFQTILSSLI